MSLRHHLTGIVVSAVDIKCMNSRDRVPVFSYFYSRYVRTAFIMRTNLYFKIRKFKSTFSLSSTDKTRIVWM